ncbi:hypothetical protein COCVIDRAFT_18522 [Bipolaris victoriae FI3]|uniref:Uncharacterized protein n=1 Tax=Bipolaris victoriae (strain FI3) TaxID=930091 RepID=W7E7E2_BIPV3|nr:hypothetical protein COCVIDRAFT_18522 [Bipolaris victoriae FI3]
MALQLFPYTFQGANGDTAGASAFFYAGKVVGRQVDNIREIERKERRVKVMKQKVRNRKEQISTVLAEQEKGHKEVSILAKREALAGILSRLEEESTSTKQSDRTIITRQQASLQSSERQLKTLRSESDGYKKAAEDQQHQANTKMFSLEQQAIRAQHELSKANKEAGRMQAKLSEADVDRSSFESQVERLRGVETELRKEIVRLGEQVREARTQAEAEKAKSNEQEREVKALQEHTDNDLAWDNRLHKETIANQEREINTANSYNEQLAEEIRGLKAALEDGQQRNESANTELDAAKTVTQRALKRADEFEQSLNTAKETHAARVVTLRDEVVTLQDKLVIAKKEHLKVKARDAKQTQAAGEDELFHTKAQAQLDIDQVHQESEQSQVKDTLERKNGELQQHVTDLEARLSKNRRDLRSILEYRITRPERKL